MYTSVNTMIPEHEEGAHQGPEAQAPSVQAPHTLSCLTSLPTADVAEGAMSPSCMPQQQQQQQQAQQQPWRLHQACPLPPPYTVFHTAGQPTPHVAQPQDHGMESTDNVSARAENSGQHTVREFIKHLAALHVGQQGIKRHAEPLDETKSTAGTCQQPAAVAYEAAPGQHGHAADGSGSSSHDSQGGVAEVEEEAEGIEAEDTEADINVDDADEGENEDEDEDEDDEEGLAELEVPSEVLEQLLRAALLLLQSAEFQLQQLLRQQAAPQVESAPSQHAAVLRLSSQLLQHCTWLEHLPSLPLTTSSIQMQDLQFGHPQRMGVRASQVHQAAVVTTAREEEDVNHWLARLQSRPVLSGRLGGVTPLHQEEEGQGEVMQEREHVAGPAEQQQVDTHGIVGQQQQQQQQQQDESCSLLLLQEHKVHITHDHVACTQHVVLRTTCWLFPPGLHPKVHSGSGAWIARRARIAPVDVTAEGSGSSSSASTHWPATASGSCAHRLGNPPDASLLAAHQQKVREQQQELPYRLQQAAELQASHAQQGASSPHKCELLLQLRHMERDEVTRLITELTQLQAQLQLPRPRGLLTWLPELLELADSLKTVMTWLHTRILSLTVETVLVSKQELVNTVCVQHHVQDKQLQAAEVNIEHGQQVPILLHGVEASSARRRQDVPVNTERSSTRRRLMHDAG